MQVLHYDLPREPEAFLHRSGRTGRAGKKGVTIAMIDPSQQRSFKNILRATKIENLEMIGSPAPADIMSASARQVRNPKSWWWMLGQMSRV